MRRKAFIRKWRLKHRAVADSLEEAGDRLFTFRLPPSQWRRPEASNAQNSKINMRKVDGWQTLSTKLIDQPTLPELLGLVGLTAF
jgi:putative transposase